MDISYLRIFSNTDTSDVMYKIGDKFYNGSEYIRIVRMTFKEGGVRVYGEEGEIGYIFPVNFEIARTTSYKPEVRMLSA